MKMHYKKIGVAVALMGLLSTTIALAESTSKDVSSNKAQLIQDRKAASQENRTQNVCERISQFAENLNQKAAGVESGVKTRQEERLTNWENKTSEADYTMESLRNGWDNNRDEQFNALEEKAQTDVQKKAVAKFKVATKAAIAARRTAMDSAIDALRSGVKSAIATRQGQTNSLVTASVSGREAALAKAKADCEAGKDAAVVRADFQNGIKGVRTQMQNDSQNMAKVKTTVQSLVQTRRMAVEKAEADFKATMEKARVALKAAFADQASATTDTAVTE